MEHSRSIGPTRSVSVNCPHDRSGPKRSLAARIGWPKDIASLALDLMCNSFITGVVVDVDAGSLLDR
jgi:hypothetical protein